MKHCAGSIDVTALQVALESIVYSPDKASAMGRRSPERINQWSFEEDICGLREAFHHVAGLPLASLRRQVKLSARKVSTENSNRKPSSYDYESEKRVLTLVNPVRWRHAIRGLPGVNRFIDLSLAIENWWFDLYHNVDTSPQLLDQEHRGWPEDKVNFHYVPIRPKCARRVLRSLPLENHSEYTFIDFGSGKGRMLLIAAGLGFRQLCGIELREELHDQACRNFRQCNNVNGCRMESIHVDAGDYNFPDERLVLFFFNPFGSEVMAKVFRNLLGSLDRRFRDVWVILHDPTCSYIADRTPQLNLEVAENGYRLYRSIPAQG
jgi:hypothetical protein